MLLNLVFIIAGIALLYYGAEWLVGGSCNLALRFGLSPLVVGLTIVAFGTSAPELAVCLRLNGTGSPNAALGNVVGSNICNILLILGISALIRPMAANRQVLKREIPILILVSLILWAMLLDGQLGTVEGGALTAGIVYYVWSSLRLASRGKLSAEIAADIDSTEQVVSHSSQKTTLLIFAGIFALVGGAELFQRGGVGLAEKLGVSKAIIGLSVLAFGTSLPELATSIVACLKKQGDIIAGNAVGSSIFNILAILGITALVSPLHVPDISPVDLSVMLGAAILGAVLMTLGRRLRRIEGAFMLLCYFLYLWLILQRGVA
jgi:cation:H+ antiporter